MAPSRLSLQPQHAFGFKSDLSEPIHFIDEQRILYVAGTYAVQFNLETKSQKLIPVTLNPTVSGTTAKSSKNDGRGADKSQDDDDEDVREEQTSDAVNTAGKNQEDKTATKLRQFRHSITATGLTSHLITAMGVSKDKKYFAVAQLNSQLRVNGLDVPEDESSDKKDKEDIKTFVFVHDYQTMKRKRVLNGTDGIPSAIISLLFSNDGRFILGITTGPDYYLYLWSIEKGTLIVSQRLFTSIFGQPTDRSSIQITSHGRRASRTFELNPLGSFESIDQQPTERKQNGPESAATGNHNSSPPTITQVSFNPYEPSGLLICVTGNRVYRTLKYLPDTGTGTLFKPAASFTKPEQRNVLCHAWLSQERVVLGTEESRILIYDGAELKHEIIYPVHYTLPSLPPNAPASAHQELMAYARASEAQGSAIKNIVPYFNGFLVGTAAGKLAIYEKSSGDVPFKKVRDVKIRLADNLLSQDEKHEEDTSKDSKDEKKNSTAKQGVQFMVMSPGEESLIITLENNNICILPLGGPNGSVLMEAKRSSEPGDSLMNLNGSMQNISVDDLFKFETVFPNFHWGKVTGMDICVRKPIVVTTSSDRTVRFFNFLDFTCELSKSFVREPLSVAIHPSGMYCVVAFQDSIKGFSILVDDMREMWESPCPKGAKELRFSTGGQKIALVVGSNLYVYNTWNGLMATSTEGESSNTHLRCIRWTKDDANILTCTSDGTTQEWALVLNKNIEPAHLQAKSNDKKAKPQPKQPLWIIQKKWEHVNRSNAPTLSSAHLPPQLLEGLTLVMEETLRSQKTTTSSASMPSPSAIISSIMSKKNLNSGPIVNESAKTFFSSSMDGVIREISSTGQNACEYHLDTIHPNFTLHATSGTLIASTVRGTIRSYVFPYQQWFRSSMKGYNESSNETNLKNNVRKYHGGIEYLELSAHSGSIIKMQITNDGRYVVSVGEDGCLMVFRIVERSYVENSGKAAAVKLANVRDVDNEEELFAKRIEKEAQNYSDEILISRYTLTDKAEMMNRLREEAEELRQQNEYQLKLKEANQQEKLDEMIQKNEKEINDMKAIVDKLREEKTASFEEHEGAITILKESNVAAIENCKTYMEQKIVAEQERCKEMIQSIDSLQRKYQAQRSKSDEARMEELGQIKVHFEAKLKEQVEIIVQLRSQIREQMRDFQTFQTDLEQTTDDEVVVIMCKYEALLKKEKETTAKICADRDVMHKKYSQLQRYVEESKNDVAKYIEDISRLHTIVKNLERDIYLLRKEVQERDETLQDKDKRISDLKKKNQELEKFKFVLDYKIKELTDQVEPKKKEILRLGQQLSQMDKELLAYHDSNASSEMSVHNLKWKLRSVWLELEREKQRKTSFDKALDKMRHEIYKMLEIVAEPKENPTGKTSLIFKNHVTGNTWMEVKSALIKLHRQYCLPSERNFSQLVPGRTQISLSNSDDPFIKNLMETPMRIDQLKAEIREELTNVFLNQPETKGMSERAKELYKPTSKEIMELVAIEVERRESRSGAHEYHRQRVHLEKAVNMFTDQRVKSLKKVKADNMRYMKDNVELLRELNLLKKDKLQHEHSLNETEKELHKAMSEHKKHTKATVGAT